MPFINRHGVPIHITQYGAGPYNVPVVLTHGFNSSATEWQASDLAADIGTTVVTWDLRGHGESGAPLDPARYSVDESLVDLSDVIEASGAPQVVLGGHSFGGYLALRFALLFPARVSALILVATGPGFKDPRARESWNAYAHEIGHVHPAGGLLAQDDSLVIDGLASILVPVLVIAGERDRRYRAGADYMAAKLPNATCHVVSAAGHRPHRDDPEFFRQSIRAFLSEHAALEPRTATDLGTAG